MSAQKNARPVDPKPLYAAVGALDLAIAELRTAADDATGKARKQVDEALATATALRKDVARRARRAGGAAEGGAEHALNTGLTVASDANQRYEALADRGTKVVGGLLDAPVVRGVAGQVDDAARLVESVRSAADKAVESLLSLTGLATRAGGAQDDHAERLPLADEPAPADAADAPAPIKPKRPSRSSVKAAAQTVTPDAEPAAAEAVAPAPKVTTTKATTSSAAARKTAAKKTTATPATRKPAKKTTGRAAGTKVTTKNVTAAVDAAAPATPSAPSAPVTPAGQAEPVTKAPIVPTDLTGPTA